MAFAAASDKLEWCHRYLLSEAQIRSYFDRFGNLSDLYLPKHVKGRNKGYGFVTFASQDTLETVLAQPHHVVDGISVQVLPAPPAFLHQI